MTENFIETPAERSEGNRLSLVAAILLGLAATLTAISAYQAALLDGEALAGYTESTATLSEANALEDRATQVFTGDQQLFVAFATAAQTDQGLSIYLTDLMRPEMLEALDWWQRTDAAVTPFDEREGNPYRIAQSAQAEEKRAQSEAAFADATSADARGDEFELATVLLALTLFFGGIASLFRRRPVAWGLLGIAVVSLGGGALQLVTALGT